jgi:lymphocyte antigen 6 complex locus protein D/E/F/G6/H
MKNSYFFLILFILCFMSKKTTALECYVCDQQEENWDKCSKTVKQCNEHEDTCASYIFWTCNYLQSEFQNQN